LSERISEKDIKLLWGRSGAKCSICKCTISEDGDVSGEPYHIGEQAHIIGKKDTAARGSSSVSLQIKNSYANLILLCPTCHTKIDKNPADYPVEKLHDIKYKHEMWVSERLATLKDDFELAQELVIASIIDKTTALCDLENWSDWVSWVDSADGPNFEDGLAQNISKYRDAVIAAVWPEDDKYKDLKKSIINFSIEVYGMIQTAQEHSDLNQGKWYRHKFYRNVPHGEKRDKAVGRYDEWLQECSNSVTLATKALNYFATIVRRDVNPLYFADHGKFLLTRGPDMTGSWVTYVPEYTEEELESITLS